MKVNDVKFLGKSVFVGMDIHKKKAVCVAICEGQVVKKWSTPFDEASLRDQLTGYFPEARVVSAYEAGFSGFKLHRILRGVGIENIVVNAASIEVQSNNRVKTDKRDALKIANQLSDKRLRCIHIPSPEEEERRSITRGREQVVSRRRSIANQLKMKLYFLGIKVPDQKVSESFMEWVEGLEMGSDHKFVIQELVEAWREETKRIKRFNEKLKIQSANDPVEAIYRSAPGVGLVSARVLSNELGDMTRFNNERELFSSSGLTPGEHSSGDRVRKGSISRQGSSRIRAILVEVAWRAIAEDTSLRIIYSRIAQTRGGKRAIIAVARKILGRLRKCLRDHTYWKSLVTEVA